MNLEKILICIQAIFIMECWIKCGKYNTTFVSQLIIYNLWWELQFSCCFLKGNGAGVNWEGGSRDGTWRSGGWKAADGMYCMREEWKIRKQQQKQSETSTCKQDIDRMPDFVITTYHICCISEINILIF